MTEHTHRPSLLAPALLVVGTLATLGGGLGVGFRAAGLGYLGQSLAALALGVVALWGGTQVEVRSRRSLLVPVPAPSVAPVALFSAQPCSAQPCSAQPFSAQPFSDRPQVRWSRPEPTSTMITEPARVRVVAWHEPCRELGSAA